MSFPRVYTRAHPNRVLLFLLSQVSQQALRPPFFPPQPRCFTTSKTTRCLKRNNTSFYVKWVLVFLIRRLIFRGDTHLFEALFRQKQAISLMEHKIHLNKLVMKLLLHKVWHLWQQKDENSCKARTHTRTRESVFQNLLTDKFLAPIQRTRRKR